MFLKLLIISIVLVALTMLLFGIKLLFNKEAEFPAHSCTSKKGEPIDQEACSACDLKDIVNCPENETLNNLKA